MANGEFDREGYCILSNAVELDAIERLLQVFHVAFESRFEGVHASSAASQVYAARNLLASVPEVRTLWQTNTLVRFLTNHLGDGFGLVRALFFDKPPDKTWNLPWHKDTAIAVKDNRLASKHFSRPTLKAGVPHLIAPDKLLRRMLTLRIHLDRVTEENGPLLVVPGSHVSRACAGLGAENAVKILAQPGDVLAMRPLISHASGRSAEGTKRHRRILHLEFAADQFLDDGIEWHDFITAAH